MSFVCQNDPFIRGKGSNIVPNVRKNIPFVCNTGKLRRIFRGSLIARGFTLIEVLVALLVLSFGLLGLAALQTVGLRYNHQSYMRSQAVYQVYDIIDRIRANAIGKTAGYYDNIPINAAPATIAVNCSTSLCTPQQLAAYDISKWKTATGLVIAQGKAGITRTVGTTKRTITLQWKEQDLNMDYAVEVDLQ